MNEIKILYHDRIDLAEGIDVNNTSESKEYDICHHWYFLDKGFKFQSYACNGWHDLSMMSMNLSNIGILKIENANYHCVITGISKSEAIEINAKC